MVELDKPVTIANYVFILLSTMMTSIAFNYVILRGLVKDYNPNKEYMENITNGSIAVYIFAILVSIAGLIYHTHAYHIIGAFINMAIAAMGLHLWTLYHNKKNDLKKIDKSFMQDIILASWILCLLTLTIFIFIYVRNDDSSF